MFSSNTSQVSTAANWIEECFSCFLYQGNGSTQTITTGIDLAGKGGMLWIKSRSQATNHIINDTARGAGNNLMSNSTSAQFTNTDNVSALSSTGFSVGVDSNTNGTAGATYASWTFRKQPKFFDVVTWTGNNADGRFISHSLGSAPGMVIIKNTSSTYDWVVWHRSLANPSKYLVLNSTAATATDIYGPFGSYDGGFTTNSACFTSTGFYVAADARSNLSGNNYVAYVFAHDAGGFGLTGTDNVISCGSFTVDGSGNSSINLGYEPQWLLMKQTNTTGSWLMQDTMRGQTADNGYARLLADTSGAETSTTTGFIRINATGFSTNGATGLVGDHIYIAIRRGPMKTPTTGTSVFDDLSRFGNATVGAATVVGFPADMVLNKRSSDPATWVQMDRLRGNPLVLFPSATDAEFDLVGAGLPSTNGFTGPNQNSYYWPAGGSNYNGLSNYASYFFRRAPGFFDVVCYTGNSTARTISHNLSVVPEMMILKSRSHAANWLVYHAAMGNTKYFRMNTSDAVLTATVWNDTTPTSTVFSVGSGATENGNAYNYVWYGFASCPGVSKVGSYTGTGTTLQIDCGFTGGARFVLIKRTDSTGDWYCWDSSRGIVSGNDPYLLLNSTAAEVTNTDYVDTYSAGFEISSTAPAAINANGGTFIFLAIA